MALNVWKCVLVLLSLASLIVLLLHITSWKYQTVSALYKFKNRVLSSNFSASLLRFQHDGTFCSHLWPPLSLEEEAEERNLLESIAWPQPPPGYELLGLSRTSDPARSRFTIVPAENGQRRYVGDQLEVRIRLRDFEGRAKSYGGDLLFARLRSARCEAGVAGQVLDHGNGLYSARFPLLWEGAAQVDVTMVHSSEAVAVLRRLRDKRSDRVSFRGVFRRGRRSETTACNLCLPQDRGPLCNYTDPRTGDPWYCYKPETLGCDSRSAQVVEGSLPHVIGNKEALLFQSGVNMKSPIRASATDTIVVLPPGKENGSREAEAAKLETSGYYYQDVWRPLGGVAAMRHFDAASIAKCLTDKLVYVYGDSTARQWYEYLVSALPGMHEFKQESTTKLGPFTAVDSSHNILLKFRFHGPPIVSRTAAAAHKLRYIANELDGLTGGPDTLVALSVWAHFAPFPVEAYIRRLRHIRRAVARLLERAPQTLVVIRTANPRAQDGEVSLIFSDWFSLQLDAVLRAMFKGLDVMLVDAWQMCLAHRLPHHVHPPREIVKNMVDMMLSRVC